MSKDRSSAFLLVNSLSAKKLYFLSIRIREMVVKDDSFRLRFLCRRINVALILA